MPDAIGLSRAGINAASDMARIGVSAGAALMGAR